MTPAGTPPEVITRLNQEILKIQQDPDFVEMVVKQAAVVKSSTPDEALVFIRSEAEKWGKIVVENNIKTD